MNKLKAQIDSGFNGYIIQSSVDEIFAKYKKRKRKIRLFSSAICVFAVISLFIGGVFTLTTKNSGLSITASAFDIESKSGVVGESKQLLSKTGVQKLSKKVCYDKNGREVSSKSAYKTSAKRTVIAPTPATLSIIGDNVSYYTIKSEKKSAVYNAKGESLLNRKVRYKNNETVNWIPSFTRLESSLRGDITLYPSTKENDAVLTEELASKLKTAKDYTNYFGDKLTITATYNNKTSESVRVVITVDENGSYFVSTEK